MARRIAVNAPLAVQATKESVQRGLALDYEAALDLETELAQRIFASEDAKEGPKAFAEKRAPVWEGR
jgi:enoyl-CoA hydratase